MAKSIPKPSEELVRDLKTKQVYHYVDSHNDIDTVSREVFKATNRVIHYPFNPRDGSPRYGKIIAIEYIDMPTDLPRGFRKAATRGLGFTRELSPLLYAIEEKYNVLRIIVGPNQVTKIAGTQVHLNSEDLDKAYPLLKSLFEQQRSEKDTLVSDILANLLPAKFTKESLGYSQGGLHRFLQQHIADPGVLSEEDISSLLGLVEQLSDGKKLLHTKKALTTRSSIEKVLIEEVIEEFKKLLKQKHETKKLEERWQNFFKEYSWMFSQLFAYPVVLFQEKAYVGGKGIDNRGGKVVDFLYQNYLSNNVALIEIKTHQTSLLGGSAYRGDDVFPVSSELTGALNQVLDQRDNLQKEYADLSKRSKKPFETFNSKCIVVVGQSLALKGEQRKSFELFRSNSRDVDIVTFDELLTKIEGLQSIMVSGKLSTQSKKKAKKTTKATKPKTKKRKVKK